MPKDLPEGMAPDLHNAAPHQQLVLRLVQLEDGSFRCWGQGCIVTFPNGQPKAQEVSKTDTDAMVLGWLQQRMAEMQNEIAPEKPKSNILLATGPVPRA